MTRDEAMRFADRWAAAWNERDIDRVVWDAANRELAIVYVAEIDGRGKRVSENLAFGTNGLTTSAEVFHGVPDR